MIHPTAPNPPQDTEWDIVSWQPLSDKIAELMEKRGMSEVEARGLLGNTSTLGSSVVE